MPATPDSYAPLLYDIKYQQLPSSPDETPAFISLPIADMFQSLMVDVRPQGGWIGTLTLFDRTGQYLCGAGAPQMLSQFQFKWAWDAAQSSLGDAPLYTGSVGYIEPHFDVRGTTLTYHLWCAGSSANARNSSAGQRSFPAGQTYDQIVQTIATSMNWQVTLIEKSVTATTQPLRMGTESHEEFIKNVLCPAAANSLNEHFVFYWDANSDGSGNGGIHFHSPSYGKRGAVTPARQYVYYADAQGEVISFAPADESLFRVLFQGTGDVDHHGIDSPGGNPAKQTTSGTSGATNTQTGTTGTPPTTADAKNTTQLANPNKAPNTKKGWLVRDPNGLNANVVSYTSWGWTLMYTANLVVKGTHDINMFDYIVVNYYTHDGTRHFLSGLFQVQSVVHTLDSGGWKTQMSIYRRGRGAPQGDPTAVQLTPTLIVGGGAAPTPSAPVTQAPTI